MYISHIVYLDCIATFPVSLQYARVPTISTISCYCIRHLFKGDETGPTQPGDICDKVHLNLKDSTVYNAIPAQKTVNMA